METSIIIPYYKTKDSEWQYKRCEDSILSQTYSNYEIIKVEKGSATHNINEGVRIAKGNIIITLGMDDYFTDKNALQSIVERFTGIWGAHGVSNNIKPVYTGDIHLGNNKMGGISSMICRKDAWIPLDETLVWLFDCKWYKDMFAKYGEPTIINGDFVTITEGEGQATTSISRDIKLKEVMTLREYYV